MNQKEAGLKRGLVGFEVLDRGIARQDHAVHHQGEEVGRVLSTSHAPKNNLVVIGPEGGLTPAELEAAVANGFRKLRLGPAVLRVETAALVAAALLGIGQWHSSDSVHSGLQE